MPACAMNPHAHPHANPFPGQVSRPPTNGLGIAGFIVSLVGLVATCGALCPIGLGLSTIALLKKPRGFAFAGFVLGLIGSVIIAVIALGGVAAAGFAADQARVHEQMADRERAQIQIAGLAERVGVYHQLNARPPLALDLLPYVDQSMLTDPWGRTFEFEPDVTGFAIRSAGPDGAAHTDDDVYQAWDFGNDTIIPRPLKTQPEDAPLEDAPPMEDPMNVDPVAPVPPIAPVAPSAPSLSIAL